MNDFTFVVWAQVRTNSDSALYDVSERDDATVDPALPPASHSAQYVVGSTGAGCGSLTSAHSVGSVSDSIHLEHIRLTDSPHALSPPAPLSPSLVMSLGSRYQLSSSSSTPALSSSLASYRKQSHRHDVVSASSDSNSGIVSMETNNSPPQHTPSTYPSRDLVNLPRSTLQASNSRLFQRRTFMPMEVGDNGDTSTVATVAKVSDTQENTKVSDNQVQNLVCDNRVERKGPGVPTAALTAAVTTALTAAVTTAPMRHSRPTISVDSSESSSHDSPVSAVAKIESRRPAARDAVTSSASHESALQAMVTEKRKQLQASHYACDDDDDSSASDARHAFLDSHLLSASVEATASRVLSSGAADSGTTDAGRWPSWLRRHSDSNLPNQQTSLQVSAASQLRSHSTGMN